MKNKIAGSVVLALCFALLFPASLVITGYWIALPLTIGIALLIVIVAILIPFLVANYRHGLAVLALAYPAIFLAPLLIWGQNDLTGSIAIPGVVIGFMALLAYGVSFFTEKD